MWNTSTLCEQHAEFFVLNLVVSIEITGLGRVNIYTFGIVLHFNTIYTVQLECGTALVEVLFVTCTLMN